jgi:hypothetical protein
MDFLIAIWLHFFADFICQTDQMALNKSKDNGWLGIHCLVYALPFLYFGPIFAIIACGTHFVIDWCTSRANAKLWANDKRHWFFTMIGFDQALHLSVLYFLL